MSLHSLYRRSLLFGYKIKTWTNTRQIHVIGNLAAKKFVDHENTHAHNIMQSSTKSYQLFLPLPHRRHDIALTDALLKVYDTMDDDAKQTRSLEEVLSDYKSIVYYCKETNTLFSDGRFSNFAKYFCRVVYELSDEQLLETLQLWELLPIEENVRVSNFIDVWNSLDLVCCNRIHRWKVNELLLFCDVWYNLRLARICDFVPEAVYKLGRKVVKMTPSQLVQTMFMCNVLRRSTFSSIDFEQNLIKTAKELSIDELGVMSMGFFKTQTPIHNKEFLTYLYQRLRQELDTVTDITFVSILKVSFLPNQWDYLR